MQAQGGQTVCTPDTSKKTLCPDKFDMDLAFKDTTAPGTFSNFFGLGD